jgi:hypothetical protein
MCTLAFARPLAYHPFREFFPTLTGDRAEPRMSVRLYHLTTEARAISILHIGSRERQGKYLSGATHTGVWVPNTPLDSNGGGKG